MENNTALVSGIIISPLSFSNEVNGEQFFSFSLVSQRQSGLKDTIIIIISERMIDCTKDYTGHRVTIYGQFRSHTKDGKLILALFATEISEYLKHDRNEIYLDGHICRQPTFRTTPLGREISDVMLLVNRHYSKSDLIPCVFWGRNAAFASSLNIGCRLRLLGRIQSREYVKNNEIYTTFEISVAQCEFVEKEAI